MDKNIRQHGGLLFSYPGMFSYNIWSEHPTPTPANVTHWFSLLSQTQQQSIVGRLEADERAVLIVQRHLVDFLQDQGYAANGVLKEYLLQSFTPAFRVDSFEFWVKNERRVAPVSTAKLNPATATEPAILELVTPAVGTAAAIEIRRLQYPRTSVTRMPVNQINSWQVTALNDDNSPAETTANATSPVSLQGLTQIKIAVKNGQHLPALKLLEVVLLDSTGNPLDTLQFTH